MRDAIDDEPPDHPIADIVGYSRAEILRAYADQLSSSEDGPSPAALPRLLEQADAVLRDSRRRVADSRRVLDAGSSPPPSRPTVPPPRGRPSPPAEALAPGTPATEPGPAGPGPATEPGPDGPGPATEPGPAGPGPATESRSGGFDAARTSGALLRAVLQTVAENLSPGVDVAPALSDIAAVVHQTVLDRFTAAADGYTGYLVDQLHRAHLDERRRVARDLHDLIAHSVAVVLQNLELSVVHRHRDRARADAKFDTALENLRGTLEMLRGISRDLRWSAADTGLAEGLRSYLEAASFDRHTDLRVTGDESAIPPAVQGELFLVVREALRNAHVHGDATQVWLQVDIGITEVRVRISDDGRGFGAAAGPEREMGTGLASMRERVALLGGDIDVCSAPGEGTLVSVRVPLTKAWDEPDE